MSIKITSFNWIVELEDSKAESLNDWIGSLNGWTGSLNDLLIKLSLVERLPDPPNIEDIPQLELEVLFPATNRKRI